MDHAPSTAQVTLDPITAECEELYRAITPRGRRFPYPCRPPPPINYSVPTEEEVEWAVRGLWGHQSGGPSRIRVEHLREWLQENRSESAAKVKAKEEESEA